MRVHVILPWLLLVACTYQRVALTDDRGACGPELEPQADFVRSGDNVIVFTRDTKAPFRVEVEANPECADVTVSLEAECRGDDDGLCCTLDGRQLQCRGGIGMHPVATIELGGPRRITFVPTVEGRSIFANAIDREPGEGTPDDPTDATDARERARILVQAGGGPVGVYVRGTGPLQVEETVIILGGVAVVGGMREDFSVEACACDVQETAVWDGDVQCGWDPSRCATARLVIEPSRDLEGPMIRVDLTGGDPPPTLFQGMRVDTAGFAVPNAVVLVERDGSTTADVHLYEVDIDAVAQDATTGPFDAVTVTGSGVGVTELRAERTGVRVAGTAGEEETFAVRAERPLSANSSVLHSCVVVEDTYRSNGVTLGDSGTLLVSHSSVCIDGAETARGLYVTDNPDANLTARHNTLVAEARGWVDPLVAYWAGSLVAEENRVHAVGAGNAWLSGAWLSDASSVTLDTNLFCAHGSAYKVTPVWVESGVPEVSFINNTMNRYQPGACGTVIADDVVEDIGIGSVAGNVIIAGNYICNTPGSDDRRGIFLASVSGTLTGNVINGPECNEDGVHGGSAAVGIELVDAGTITVSRNWIEPGPTVGLDIVMKLTAGLEDVLVFGNAMAATSQVLLDDTDGPAAFRFGYNTVYVDPGGSPVLGEVNDFFAYDNLSTANDIAVHDNLFVLPGWNAVNVGTNHDSFFHNSILVGSSDGSVDGIENAMFEEDGTTPLLCNRTRAAFDPHLRNGNYSLQLGIPWPGASPAESFVDIDGETIVAADPETMRGADANPDFVCGRPPLPEIPR